MVNGFIECYAQTYISLSDQSRKRRGSVGEGGGGGGGELKKYMEEMLNDLRTMHRSREEQLSSAAQSYRQRMKDVIRRHEELLVSYR